MQDNSSPTSDPVTLTVGQNGLSTTYAGAMSGSGALVKACSGTLTLTGFNGYAGGTSIAAGTLRLGSRLLCPARRRSISSSGMLDLGGFSQQIASLNDYAAGNFGTVTNNGAGIATLTLSPTGGSAIFSGVIQNGSGGTTALVVSGAGTQVLAGANTFTGGTTVSAGTLLLSSASTLGGVATISGGTLQLGNDNAAQNATVAVSTTNGLAFSAGIGTFNVGGLAVRRLCPDRHGLGARDARRRRRQRQFELCGDFRRQRQPGQGGQRHVVAFRQQHGLQRRDATFPPAR